MLKDFFSLPSDRIGIGDRNLILTGAISDTAKGATQKAIESMRESLRSASFQKSMQEIDAQDAVYAQLRVWRDMNQDGISQADELFSLEALGIQSLDLNHQNLNQRQSDGNTLARLGSYSDAQGQARKMGDFLLAHNGMISRFSDEIDLSSADKQAVNLRGMGRLRDLQSAAAMGRSNLKAVIKAYTHAETK